MGSLKKVEVETLPRKKNHQEKVEECPLCSRVSTVLGISPSLREWVGCTKGPCHMQEISHMRNKRWTKVAYKDHEQKTNRRERIRKMRRGKG